MTAAILNPVHHNTDFRSVDMSSSLDAKLQEHSRWSEAIATLYEALTLNAKCFDGLTREDTIKGVREIFESKGAAETFEWGDIRCEIGAIAERVYQQVVIGHENVRVVEEGLASPAVMYRPNLQNVLMRREPFGVAYVLSDSDIELIREDCDDQRPMFFAFVKTDSGQMFLRQAHQEPELLQHEGAHQFQRIVQGTGERVVPVKPKRVVPFDPKRDEDLYRGLQYFGLQNLLPELQQRTSNVVGPDVSKGACSYDQWLNDIRRSCLRLATREATAYGVTGNYLVTDSALCGGRVWRGHLEHLGVVLKDDSAIAESEKCRIAEKFTEEYRRYLRTTKSMLENQQRFYEREQQAAEESNREFKPSHVMAKLLLLPPGHWSILSQADGEPSEVEIAELSQLYLHKPETIPYIESVLVGLASARAHKEVFSVLCDVLRRTLEAAPEQVSNFDFINLRTGLEQCHRQLCSDIKEALSPENIAEQEGVARQEMIERMFQFKQDTIELLLDLYIYQDKKLPMLVSGSDKLEEISTRTEESGSFSNQDREYLLYLIEASRATPGIYEIHKVIEALPAPTRLGLSLDAIERLLVRPDLVTKSTDMPYGTPEYVKLRILSAFLFDTGICQEGLKPGDARDIKAIFADKDSEFKQLSRSSNGEVRECAARFFETKAAVLARIDDVVKRTREHDIEQLGRKLEAESHSSNDLNSLRDEIIREFDAEDICAFLNRTASKKLAVPGAIVNLTDALDGFQFGRKLNSLLSLTAEEYKKALASEGRECAGKSRDFWRMARCSSYLSYVMFASLYEQSAPLDDFDSSGLRRTDFFRLQCDFEGNRRRNIVEEIGASMKAAVQNGGDLKNARDHLFNRYDLADIAYVLNNKSNNHLWNPACNFDLDAESGQRLTRSLRQDLLTDGLDGALYGIKMSLVADMSGRSGGPIEQALSIMTELRSDQSGDFWKMAVAWSDSTMMSTFLNRLTSADPEHIAREQRMAVAAKDYGEVRKAFIAGASRTYPFLWKMTYRSNRKVSFLTKCADLISDFNPARF